MTNLNHTQGASFQDPGVSAANLTGNAPIQEAILWKLLLLTGLTYLIWSDKISIVLGPETAQHTERNEVKKVRAGLFDFSINGPKKEKTGTEVKITIPVESLNNVTFMIDPAYADRHQVSADEVEKKNIKCRDYVAHYAPVAIAEMRRCGIPASITLAQGLLESNAGASKLAQKTNNHFRIKCLSNECKKGHCIDFQDGVQKDFFVRYSNAWESFRAHSDLLSGSGKYLPLFELDQENYKGWARGLVEAGYTPDKQYGEKLIAIIQTMELYRYDQQALP